MILLVLISIVIIIGNYLYIFWYLMSISKIDSFLRDSGEKSFNKMPLIANMVLQSIAYALYILTMTCNYYNKNINDVCDSLDANC